MKKVFLLTAIAGLFAFSSVKAQKDVAMTGPKLGIGAEFAFPMGDFGDVYKLGYGGSLLYQHPVATNLNLTGSAGYLSFKAKDEFGGGSYGSIPVKAGARYFVAENFYIGGELGAAFSTESGGKTAFAYSPGIGIEFPVSDGGAIELGGRYEGWSANSTTSSFIGLRLAYNFGL
ncbi:outer membrane beta-barrel protein [Pedobacter panaciterrae]|uniref:Outer membrane beta-barrel protein n=1 Tax=Pedobacter panaciterrae TaxID=363849 RepID=A0ABU8NK24_9SPHI